MFDKLTLQNVRRLTEQLGELRDKLLLVSKNQGIVTGSDWLLLNEVHNLLVDLNDNASDIEAFRRVLKLLVKEPEETFDDD